MAFGKRNGRRSRADQQHAAGPPEGHAGLNGQAAALESPAPTPHRLQALAAAAISLAESIEAADQHLSTDETYDTRAASVRLDAAARSCRAIASELEATAGELTRITAVGGVTCDIAWGVCPNHGITLLVPTGDAMTCRVPGCREGSADPITHRCGEPVKYRVVDAAGAAFLACTGHALACRQQLTGAVITLASDSLETL